MLDNNSHCSVPITSTRHYSLTNINSLIVFSVAIIKTKHLFLTINSVGNFVIYIYIYLVKGQSNHVLLNGI